MNKRIFLSSLLLSVILISLSMSISFAIAVIALVFYFPGHMSFYFFKTGHAFILFILILEYFISFWIGHQFYPLMICDFINMLTLLIFIFLLSNSIKTLTEFKIFIQVSLALNFIFAFILSLLGLLRLLFQTFVGPLPLFYSSSAHVFGMTSALRTDYNLYALACLFGLLSYIFMSYCKQYFKYGSLMMLIIIMAILFSGSRRILIFLILTGIYLLLSQPPSYLKKIFFIKMSISKPHKGLFYFLFFMLGCLSIFFLIYKNLTIFEPILHRYLTLAQGLLAIEDGRLARFKFAFFLYANSDWLQQLFGSGFHYLTLFPESTFFSHSKTLHADYPHNIFLSALLYGGLVNLMFTLIYTANAFINFLKSNPILRGYFFIFIFDFCFVMSSSNTIFTNIEFMCLATLPFVSNFQYKTTKINPDFSQEQTFI